MSEQAAYDGDNHTYRPVLVPSSTAAPWIIHQNNPPSYSSNGSMFHLLNHHPDMSSNNLCPISDDAYGFFWSEGVSSNNDMICSGMRFSMDDDSQIFQS
ncbi:hypothetical protein SAY86_008140 [Trapa natans]|uniref:Uncharacterized protein n=1 Tax=Trapa natans TaxID=22666 RepID=A0AAN7K9N2_TRANT|nr:hypothetical protein SAY86_008140 [Trapa natans]